MNVVQGVNAIIQSPEIAIMAAQAVQASDLAARQGVSSLIRDAERQQDQVQDPKELGETEMTGQRRQAPEDPWRRRRRQALLAAAADSDPAPRPAQRLDILA